MDILSPFTDNNNYIPHRNERKTIMKRYTFYFCTALLGTVLLYSSSAFAQGMSKPVITNIPGGFFAEWALPVELSQIKFDKRLSGRFVVMFDVPSVESLEGIDRRPPATASPEMVTVLADYWIVRGKPERAIPLYEASLAQGNLDDTKTFVFQNNLAMLYSQALGEHGKALEIVDNALSTNRDSVTLLDTKGLVLLNAGNSLEAIPVLQQAVVLSCELPIYCMHLAYALYQEGRFVPASGYFDKAREGLIPLIPTMTKENKAMFDTLQSTFTPGGN